MEIEIKDSVAERGGRSTIFFHKVMIQHRQHNRIFSLVDQEGNHLTQKEYMENLLVQRIQNLLTKPNIERTENINRITQHIPQLVSRDQNLALLREITKSEVEDVIKGLAKNKAPSS